MCCSSRIINNLCTQGGGFLFFSVGVALQTEGIVFEQLDGACSLQQRERSLEKFRQDPNVQLLLATIGAGGVGIDLTSAQKVYLMVSPPDDVWENRPRTQGNQKNPGAILESER